MDRLMPSGSATVEVKVTGGASTSEAGGRAMQIWTTFEMRGGGNGNGAGDSDCGGGSAGYGRLTDGVGMELRVLDNAVLVPESAVLIVLFNVGRLLRDVVVGGSVLIGLRLVSADVGGSRTGE